MLDIHFIRDNADAVKKAVQNKNQDVDIDRLLALDLQKQSLEESIEKLRHSRNEISAKMKSGRDDTLIAEAKQIKDDLHAEEEKLTPIHEEWLALMDKVPNVPSEDTPIGKDESENQVIKQVGDKPSFSFTPKPHWEIGESLGIINKDKAAEISGARFAYLMGDLALMEFALVHHAMHTLGNRDIIAKLITENDLQIPDTPFTPVIPPVFVRPDVFSKMDRLNPPEDKYYIESDDLYLVGSAEHTLGPFHMNETIEEAELPIRYLGFSTAFRREAGSYGKDTRGILRMHQFDKLEMESFTKPEWSVAEQNLFVAIQEYLMQSLELPYQVVSICTGDMGKPDYRQIDIETWMPGQDTYRETQTSDLMTDFQARRLGIRLKRDDGKTEFLHMNDATAFAIGRTLIAIIENYQREDGSVGIPTVLQQYMNKTEIK